MFNRRIVSSLSKRATILALCIGTGLAPAVLAQEATPAESPPSAPPAFEPPAPPVYPTPPEAYAGTMPATAVDA
jgi:hypothetical protein